MTVGWIAERIEMGTRGHLNHLPYRLRKSGGKQPLSRTDLYALPDQFDGHARLGGEVRLHGILLVIQTNRIPSRKYPRFVQNWPTSLKYAWTPFIQNR